MSEQQIDVATLVSSLTVVVLDTTCANIDCTTQLGKFEMDRVRGKKRLGKQNFCIKCRRNISRIDYIRCQKCGNRTPFGSFNKWCEKCRGARR